ncbi:MAG TPA: hypothetical protein DDW52_08480 [Planctomycetaceae bacterium]|nr:hypothetical protein [Planctomycetaceae bacterium]
MSSASNSQLTLAEQVTAPVPAGIATIVVCGPAAVDIVSKHVNLRGPLDLGKIRYGQWTFTSSTEDEHAEQVVVCQVKSETVEISCHGGRAVTRAILLSLQQAGVVVGPTPAAPQISLIAANAQAALVAANTDRAAAILLDQLNGALAHAVDETLTQVQRGEFTAAEQALEALDSQGRLGLRLSTGWQVVLAGPPNAGKSSLINALAGKETSIVHSTPGTTRDWVESSMAVGGWPVRVSDTAGIRQSSDPIEQAGVRLARERIAQADVVLLVIDAAAGWTQTHADLLTTLKNSQDKSLLPVVNKADLVSQSALDSLAAEISQIVGVSTIATSCNSAPGIEHLLVGLSQTMVPTPPTPGTAVPFFSEAVSAIQRALQSTRQRDSSAACAVLSPLLRPAKQ